MVVLVVLEDVVVLEEEVLEDEDVLEEEVLVMVLDELELVVVVLRLLSLKTLIYHDPPHIWVASPPQAVLHPFPVTALGSIAVPQKHCV